MLPSDVFAFIVAAAAVIAGWVLEGPNETAALTATIVVSVFVFLLNASSAGRRLARGKATKKALETWTPEEVQQWYGTLPKSLQQYQPALLPADGLFVSRWTEKVLYDASVSKYHSSQLRTYRDQIRETTSRTEPTQVPTTKNLHLNGNRPGPSLAKSLSLSKSLSLGKSLSLSLLGSPKAGGASMFGFSRASHSKARRAISGKCERIHKDATYVTTIISPLLPPPGAQVASMLAYLLEVADGSFGNEDNMLRLLEQAVDLLEVVKSNVSRMQRDRSYSKMMNSIRDILIMLQAYGKEYMSRNWMSKVFTAKGDEALYEDIAQQLRDLTIQATFAISVDTNQATLELKESVAELERQLKEKTVFEDPSLKLQEAIDAVGGLQAALGDKSKMMKAIFALGWGTKCDMLTLQQSIASFEADRDDGSHRHIKQPDMRVFWQSYLKGMWQVPWIGWWSIFPRCLSEFPMCIPKEDIKQIELILDSPRAQEAFQQHVERFDDVHISVDEVNMAFPSELSVLEAVKRLAAVVEAHSKETVATSAMGSFLPFGNSGSRVVRQTKSLRHMATMGSRGVPCRRCWLPDLDVFHTGRDRESENILAKLNGGGVQAVCLVGAVGFGKSGLAIDTGWRMWRRGLLPGGAMMIGMREACVTADVHAAFCTALDISLEGDIQLNILAKLENMAENGTLLLVVDSAEDPLLGKDKAAFLELIQRILVEVPAARIIFTSRNDFPELPHKEGAPNIAVTNEQVLALDSRVAQKLVQAVACELSASEAAEVAACVLNCPLLLRLVADALSSGRVAMEDVRHAASSQEEDSGGVRTPETIFDRLWSGRPGRGSPHTPVSGPRSSSRRPTTETPTKSKNSTPSSLYYATSQSPKLAPSKEPLKLMPKQLKVALTLVLQSLPKRQQLALAQLSVFPSNFDDEGAAAVMDCAPLQAHALLTVMYKHGLMKFNRSDGLYSLHRAVRLVVDDVIGGQVAGQRVIQAAKTEFMLHMARLMEVWADMYFSTSVGLVLQQVRARSADIQAALEMMCEVEATDANIMAVAASITEGARNILYALGLNNANSRGSLKRFSKVLLEHVEEMEASFKAQVEAGGPGARQACKELLVLQPLLANSLAAIAQGLEENGQYERARETYERCYKARLKTLGPKDEAVLASMLSIASCLLSSKRVAEAHKMLHTCLAACNESLGGDHPQTIDCQRHLAYCYEAQGDCEAALPLFQRCVELYSKCFGEHHPDTITAILSEASCLQGLGRFDEAIPRYNRNIELSTRILGPKHQSTAASMLCLATCLQEQEEYGPAEAMFDQCVHLFTKICGFTHPCTLNALTCLSSCLLAQNKYSRAMPALKRLYDTKRKLWGETHRETLESKQDYNFCLGKVESPSRKTSTRGPVSPAQSR